MQIWSLLCGIKQPVLLQRIWYKNDVCSNTATHNSREQIVEHLLFTIGYIYIYVTVYCMYLW